MQRLGRRRLAAAGVAVVAVIAVGGAMLVRGTPTPSPTPRPSASPTTSPTPTPSPSPSPMPTAAATCPFTGEPVAVEELAGRQALLVQIENHPEARPASGLSLADLVVEAPVEGDTTRFGAVYLCRATVGAVGPVRSGRYYNVDLWQQLGVLTMHFGAGSRVLSAFNASGMPYVNGITGDYPEFRRTGDRPAPHNVHLDIDAVRASINEGGPLADIGARTGETRSPFAFAPDATPPPGDPVTSVEIQTNDFWRFGWSYDAGERLWHRSDAGVASSDALTDGPITARSVMVQVVTEEVLRGELDPGGYPRRLQHLVGAGSGVLFVDGQSHAVRWSRASSDLVTSWTYADSGEPVVLPPGRTWWEIVPVGSRITPPG